MAKKKRTKACYTVTSTATESAHSWGGFIKCGLSTQQNRNPKKRQLGNCYTNA